MKTLPFTLSTGKSNENLQHRIYTTNAYDIVFILKYCNDNLCSHRPFDLDNVFNQDQVKFPIPFRNYFMLETALSSLTVTHAMKASNYF